MYSEPRKRCRECGALLPPAIDTCVGVYERVLVREFGDERLDFVHRLTVDSYSLQHPGTYCRSARSLAAHLTGLCWVFDYGGDPGIDAALRRWLDTLPSAIHLLTPPESPGGLTIVDVRDALSRDSHAERVIQWARCVWESWSEHHDTAQAWVETARASGYIK